MKFIKYIVILTLILSNSYLYSQDDTALVKRYNLNFTVPDYPAFKILGVEPSNLLKPSITDIISFLGSQNQNIGNLLLPVSFAAEISPMMLINSNSITLQDFNKKHILYSMRISVGTSKTGNDSATQLGVGFRLTLINKGDLRSDKNYQNKIYNALGDREKLKRQFQEEYIISHPGFSIGKEEDQQLLKNYVIQKTDEQFNFKFDSLKKVYEDINWNKEKLDLALALSGASPDSLSKVTVRKYSGWITYGQHISSWGQILIGGSYDNNIADRSYDIFLNSRFYAGVNKAKGFLEIQYDYEKQDFPKKLLFNLGTELSLFNGFWINYYAGLEYTYFNSATSNKFVSHFDMRYALP